MMKRSRFILAFGVLILAALACQSGTTPEPAPPSTMQPADTAAPAAPTVAATPTAQIYFTEQFDQNSPNWRYFVIDNSIPSSAPSLMTDISGVSINAAGGRMVFDFSKQYRYAYLRYMNVFYEDVRLDAVAENRGVNDNYISLICRYTKEEGWYEFNIANNGLYNIYHASWTPDDKVVFSRLANGGSNKIKQGKEINKYSITCKGHTLSLSINGFETRQIQENQYALRTGNVGISASSGRLLPVKIEFDSVTISQP